MDVCLQTVWKGSERQVSYSLASATDHAAWGEVEALKWGERLVKGIAM